MEQKLQVKKCLCGDPTCAKCLGVNCEDKECQVHTKEKKQIWQRNWEKGNRKKFPYPKNY